MKVSTLRAAMFFLFFCFLLLLVAPNALAEGSSGNSVWSLESDDTIPANDMTPAEAVIEPASKPAKPGETVPWYFVRIPGGSFTMGSPADEAGRKGDEAAHKVTVGGFSMARHEVTRREWIEIMGKGWWEDLSDNLPVTGISWLEAAAYCNALSKKEGLKPAYTIKGSAVTWNRGADGYRLPTEAEWEYACRAGTQTPWGIASFSVLTANIYAWQNYDNRPGWASGMTSPTRGEPLAVEQLAANAWGLFEMHGNVSEYCYDVYGPYGASAQTDPANEAGDGTVRVVRGGNWSSSAYDARSASRSSIKIDDNSRNKKSDNYTSTLSPANNQLVIGFRIVRSGASYTIAAKPAPPQPPANKTYKIGDKGPAGGLVFYDKGTYSDGWRYLEAAPGDLTATWGLSDSYIIDDTKTGIGEGKRNTAVIAELVKLVPQFSTLPEQLAALEINGYGGWFMPSLDELVLIYKNLAAKGLGGFDKDWYFSSSEQLYNGNGYVHCINFGGTGERYGYHKFNVRPTRPVRVF